jgi:hypothetical protein
MQLSLQLVEVELVPHPLADATLFTITLPTQGPCTKAVPQRDKVLRTPPVLSPPPARASAVEAISGCAANLRAASCGGMAGAPGLARPPIRMMSARGPSPLSRAKEAARAQAMMAVWPSHTQLVPLFLLP